MLIELLRDEYVPLARLFVMPRYEAYDPCVVGAMQGVTSRVACVGKNGFKHLNGVVESLA